LACASASPVWPVLATSGYVGYPASFSSQYHAQDELGQASYGFAYPGHASSNYRDAFGNQVGSYAYINAEGKQVQVSYTADHRGFRVLSNDLPVAPVDENKAPVFEGKAPEPVQDTPEVTAAKAEHFRIKEEAAAAAAAAPAVVPVAEPVVGDAPVVQAAPVEEAPVADAPDAVEKPVAEPIVEDAPVAPVAEPIAEDAPVAPVAEPIVEDAPVASVDVAPVADAPDALVEVEAARKKRQVPLLPYTSAVYGTPLHVPWVAPAPLVAKTTLKTVTAEADLTAKTPADTNKFDLKEKSFEVFTPYAYTYPNAYPYVNGFYGYY